MVCADLILPLGYAAVTEPHTRQEQANMRAAIIMARELLRCRLAEGGRDALLERVAELLDAACRGAAPFCSLSTPQVVEWRVPGPNAPVPSMEHLKDSTAATRPSPQLIAPQQWRQRPGQALAVL